METADWQNLTEAAIAARVSDMHLTAGQAVFFRSDGVMQKQDILCTENLLKEFLAAILSPAQKEKLARELDLDFAWSYGAARFRGNAYYQQGQIALALRLLPQEIPTLRDLGAPKALGDMLTARQGLCLITGKTGAGKSTTLAAFIETLNRQCSAHVITLEDPIEFLYHPKKCFFSQRDFLRDFGEFPRALKSALREMPDVILVGEIRDAATMETAMMAAEAGALVLGTLHTRGAAETVRRVEGMFPLGQREAVRDRLAGIFLGIFSQCLLPSLRGGRVSVTEVLLSTAASRNLIRQGNYSQLDSVMMSGGTLGMQTMQTALEDRRKSGFIDGKTLEQELKRRQGA